MEKGKAFAITDEKGETAPKGAEIEPKYPSTFFYNT